MDVIDVHSFGNGKRSSSISKSRDSLVEDLSPCQRCNSNFTGEALRRNSGCLS